MSLLRGVLLLAPLAIAAFVVTPQAQAQTPAEEPDLAPLCAPLAQLAQTPGCPDAGPGYYLEQLESAGLSYPLPALVVERVSAYRGLPHPYGRVITDAAPVFRHPAEAVAGLAPVRAWEKGFVFVSVLGTVTYQERVFYQINASEYMRAEDITDVRPSGWSGAHVAGAGTKFGWVIRPTQRLGDTPHADQPGAWRTARPRLALGAALSTGHGAQRAEPR